MADDDDLYKKFGVSPGDDLYKKFKPREQPDLGNAIGAAMSDELKLEDAPTITEIKTPPANLPTKLFGSRDDKGVLRPMTGSQWLNRGSRALGLGNVSDDRPGVPLSSALALGFGPTSTDNPKARQEIVSEHLPGAKAVTDKWGNPMIEYEGKRYYTSRPGELDSMDVQRGLHAILGMAPAAAIAPVSGPGAVVAGGLLNIGQSYAEDAVARASGGKSQTYDHDKAAVAGTIGTFVPVIGKMLAHPAAWAFGKMRGPLFDAAGQPTMRGMSLLREAGLTQQQIDTMTPEIREQIVTMTNRSFGDPNAARAGYNTGLSDEFGMPLTTGEITGDAAQIAREKNLRGGSSGPGPQNIMQGYEALRRERLNTAQETIRRQAGGGQTFTPQEATTVLTGEQQAAQARAKLAGDVRFGEAKDPNYLGIVGIPPTVPIKDVATVGGTVREQLSKSGPGRNVIDFPHNTPTAAQALADIEKWAAGQAGPRGVDVTEMSWEQIQNMRIQLTAMRSDAVQSGKAMDAQAMDDIIKGFDQHFPQNPLLTAANKAHGAMKETFTKQDSHTPLTNQLLTRLNDPASSIAGGEIVDTLLDAAKGGKAVEALNHLTAIHPPGSPGHNVISEQSIMRLLVDKRGNALSPQKIVTAIDDALGQQQGPFYRTLLTEDQISRLTRFRELMSTVAEATRPNNPSGSGHRAVDAARSATNQVAGASLGVVITDILGGSRVGQLAGGAAGRAAGMVVGDAVQTGNASRAINPGPNTGITPNRAGPTSLLAAPVVEGADREQMPPTGAPTAAGPAIGPVDRLWRGILGGP